MEQLAGGILRFADSCSSGETVAARFAGLAGQAKNLLTFRLKAALKRSRPTLLTVKNRDAQLPDGVWASDRGDNAGDVASSLKTSGNGLNGTYIDCLSC